jgi:hypothetical protein
VKRKGEILRDAYASASSLGAAFAIERDPAKRQIYGLAAMVKLARVLPYERPLRDRDYRMAEWLLLRASPIELRAIADALELEGVDLDGARLKIITAYTAALEESDRKFRWRDVLELEMPGKRIMCASPLQVKGLIESPPNWKQFKNAFVRLFGTRCLPERYSVKKTLTNFYGLPLAESKRGPSKKI